MGVLILMLEGDELGMVIEMFAEGSLEPIDFSLGLTFPFVFNRLTSCVSTVGFSLSVMAPASAKGSILLGSSSLCAGVPGVSGARAETRTEVSLESILLALIFSGRDEAGVCD